jgi:pyruvate-formate lyase
LADTFNMSGDFRGAILNINSTLTNVQQTVGDIKSNDNFTKEELKQLIGQLNQELQNTPPEKSQEAEAVAQTAQTLIEQAKEERPNKTMLSIAGESLKQAAKNLADATPAVVAIASQIVMAVIKLTGKMP